jgi:non-heme chloroperoxidase
VAKVVLIDAVTPVLLKSPNNPQGLPMEIFDTIRKQLLADRSQFLQDFTVPFYGANRPSAKVSQGVRDSFWLMGMQAGFNAVYDCVKAFSETDFTKDLREIDVPALVLHGDDDQIVPIAATGVPASKLLKNARLEVVKGASHGLCQIEKDKVNADLLSFFKS